MATQITNVTELQAMENDLNGAYELANDIDASATSTWNAGAGFDPVGGDWLVDPFTGTFDGKGFKITNLFINRPATSYIGLFGSTTQSGLGGSVKNITLENCDITGDTLTGTLIGDSFGNVESCSSSGTVHADASVGGLFGYIWGDSTRCYSSCTVTSDGDDDQCGGLAGLNNSGTMSKCYATGSVTMSGTGRETGGLIGYNTGTISDCYATGAVDGDQYVGGFCGYNNEVIDNCYSTGAATGNDDVGGFCGYNNDTITNCFWDTETSGNATSSGGTGKTTAQMQTVATFTAAGWDFTNIWNIFAGENSGYPFLMTSTYGDVGFIWIEDSHFHYIDENGTERQVLIPADVDDTPVNGVTTAPISSNWAYDHENAADPHAGYVLESLFDAQTILSSISDNTPVALTVAEQEVVGRLTGGNIDGIALGIADNNIAQVDGSPNDDEYARWTANGLEGRTEAEFKGDFNLEIGTDVLAQQTIGIADDNLVEIDHASVADDDYAKFTANGLEGRSYAEVLADLSGQAGAAFAWNSQNLTGVGSIAATGLITITDTGGDNPYINLVDSNGSHYIQITGNILRLHTLDSTTLADTKTLRTDTNAGDYFMLQAYNTNDAVYKDAIKIENTAVASAGAILTLQTNLLCSGSETIDGRDVSVDGSKLDGIATGADVTADNAPQAHAASHAVGGADTTLPADPNADKYLMWDDDPGELVWADVAGGGDVSGPAASTDNMIARHDGAGGKTLQDYTSNPPTISDTGDMTVDGDVTADNIITAGNVDGRDVSTDGGKLDGVEAAADVTDATNVAAAGAVMDGDFTAADEVMVGTGAGTHGQVTLAASQFLAKKAAGAATNVTAAEARTILNVADGANAYTHPNHSGEVTSVADGAQTIANDAVTYAKMQNVSATDKVLGRATAGAGDVEEIACTAAGRALLDDADAAAQKTTLSLNNVENTAHSTDAHTMAIDGRDVSVDGTKLDGIATGADVTGDNAPQAHDLGGASHNADTLANLNTKVSDATLLDQSTVIALVVALGG